MRVPEPSHRPPSRRRPSRHRHTSPSPALLAAAVSAALAAPAPAQQQFGNFFLNAFPPSGGGASALGDVDLDGHLDIVVAVAGGQNRLYLNDAYGTGIFTDVTATRMPVDNDSSVAVVLGDVDGDGDPDILFGNRGEQNRLESNMLRQLHAPARPQIGQSYRLDVYARYGPPRLVDVALPYLSLAPAAIPLPPFGTLGIDPNQSVALPAVVVPQPAGIGAAAFAVP